MRQPSKTTMAFGHPVVCAVLIGLTALAFISAPNPEPSVILVVMTLVCLGYNRTRREYLDWKREWESFDGAPRRRGPPKLLKQIIGFLLLAFLLFLTFAPGALQREWQVGMQFVLGLTVVIAAGRALLRHRRSKREETSGRHKREPEFVVGQVLGKPNDAPRTTQQWVQALPSHCIQLLSQRPR